MSTVRVVDIPAYRQDVDGEVVDLPAMVRFQVTCWDCNAGMAGLDVFQRDFDRVSSVDDLLENHRQVLQQLMTESGCVHPVPKLHWPPLEASR